MAGVGGMGTGGMPSGSGGSGGASPPPCPVGVVECNGTVKQVCDGNGGYSEIVDCGGTNEICYPGIGCLTCVPGTGSCNGDTGMYCKPDGMGFLTEQCDPLQGTTCNMNTGRCDGACSPKAIGKSYIGCDYFPTVTANIVATQFNFAVAVSNTTASNATVTVTQGANTVKSATVAANSVQVITLPWVSSLKGPASNSAVAFPSSVKVTAGAYRLRSTQPVTVYQFSPLEYALSGNNSFTNDASLLLPVNAWTGTYRVASRNHFSGMSGFLAVTAQANNTKVTLTAGPQSGQVKSGVTGIGTNGAGTVTLNAGDVLELVTNGGSAQNDPNDVTGMLVSADKAVQVISGHQCVFVPYSVGYCDHLEESMFPYETLANEYIVTAPLIPTGGSTPKVEMVRIVATKPNTTLSYDPPQSGAPASIAAAGGWVEIQNNNKDFQISANEPILVVQYMEGQDAGGGSGDPAMANAVAKSQYRNSYLFHAPTNYEKSYVNVVAKTGEAVTLDGQAIPAGSFVAIGGTGYSVARVSVSNSGNGNHNISAAQPFGISVYGYGQYTSYWYPGGSNLAILHQ